MKKRIPCALLSLVMVLLLIPRVQAEEVIDKNFNRNNYYSDLLNTVSSEQLDYLHQQVVNAENTEPDTWYPNLIRVVLNKEACGLNSENQGLSTYLRYNYPDVIGYYGIYVRYKYGAEAFASYDCVLDPDIAQRRQELNERLPKMMEEVNALLPENPTQFERVHVAHDYIIANTYYDKVQISSNVDETYDYDIYGVFCKHKSACAGYSMALKYILNQWGMECMMVTSTNQNHGWNVVKVDGEWYHVDVSSDDPFYDMLGQVSHKYLCISTQTLLGYNSGRADFRIIPDYDQRDMVFNDATCCTHDYEGTAGDALSSRNLWKNSISVCHYYNDHLYTICPDAGISSACALYRDGVQVYTPGSSFMAWYDGSIRYNSPQGRMTALGKDLYMTSSNGIYYVDLSQEPLSGTLCFTIPQDAEQGSQFFGLARIEGKLCYTAELRMPSGNEVWVEFTPSPMEFDLPSGTIANIPWSIDPTGRLTVPYLNLSFLFIAGYSATGQMTGVAMIDENNYLYPPDLPIGTDYTLFCVYDTFYSSKTYLPKDAPQSFRIGVQS